MFYVSAFVVGYIAAVFTWDRLHAWIIGAGAKIDSLRAKARELADKVKD